MSDSLPISNALLNDATAAVTGVRSGVGRRRGRERGAEGVQGVPVMWVAGVTAGSVAGTGVGDLRLEIGRLGRVAL